MQQRILEEKGEKLDRKQPFNPQKPRLQLYWNVNDVEQDSRLVCHSYTQYLLYLEQG